MGPPHRIDSELGIRRSRISAKVRAVSLFLALIAAYHQALGQNSLPPGNLPMQPLGPNDLISVTVLGVPELSRSVRIAGDGSIRLPLLDQPIPAAGKLPQALEPEIAAALRRNELVL